MEKQSNGSRSKDNNIVLKFNINKGFVLKVPYSIKTVITNKGWFYDKNEKAWLTWDFKKAQEFLSYSENEFTKNFINNFKLREMKLMESELKKNILDIRSRCDYAQSTDSLGFNATDAKYGWSLDVSIPWGIKNLTKAAYIVYKYRKQILQEENKGKLRTEKVLEKRGM